MKLITAQEATEMSDVYYMFHVMELIERAIGKNERHADFPIDIHILDYCGGPREDFLDQFCGIPMLNDKRIEKLKELGYKLEKMEVVNFTKHYFWRVSWK